MARRADSPRHVTTSFFFEAMEPGEVTSVGRSHAIALRPMSVFINASDFKLGATFDALLVGGEVAATASDLENPVRLVVPAVQAGVEVELRLRNEGSRTVRPVAVVVFKAEK